MQEAQVGLRAGISAGNREVKPKTEALAPTADASLFRRRLRHP